MHTRGVSSLDELQLRQRERGAVLAEEAAEEVARESGPRDGVGHRREDPVELPGWRAPLRRRARHPVTRTRRDAPRCAEMRRDAPRCAEMRRVRRDAKRGAPLEQLVGQRHEAIAPDEREGDAERRGEAGGEEVGGQLRRGWQLLVRGAGREHDHVVADFGRRLARPPHRGERLRIADTCQRDSTRVPALPFGRRLVQPPRVVAVKDEDARRAEPREQVEDRDGVVLGEGAVEEPDLAREDESSTPAAPGVKLRGGRARPPR